MKIGMIGLGRMGANMARRLMRGGHRCVAYDHSQANVKELAADGAGEGRWTIAAALEEGVSAEVLSTALFTRFRSRIEHSFAEKVLSAMRKGFGGHIERPHVEKVNPGL